VFFSFLIGVGVVYLFLYSGLFDIKGFEVNGYSFADNVRDIATGERDRNIFSKNIILFNTSSLKETLAGDSRIQKIEIKKKFPNIISINITESSPSLIWSTAGESYLVDGWGVVIGKKKNENYPEVADAANIQVKPGDRVASPTFIKFIRDISSGFEASTGAKVSRITIFDLLTDVHILSSDGWTVYLDATKSSDAQLKNLAKVLAEAKKSSTKKLEYIDMRLDTKIFYK
jgi:cell division septal protein FtsQ